MKLIRIVAMLAGLFTTLTATLATSHLVLSLDNLDPQQLEGVLNGNWK